MSAKNKQDVSFRTMAVVDALAVSELKPLPTFEGTVTVQPNYNTSGYYNTRTVYGTSPAEVLDKLVEAAETIKREATLVLNAEDLKAEIFIEIQTPHLRLGWGNKHTRLDTTISSIVNNVSWVRYSALARLQNVDRQHNANIPPASSDGFDYHDKLSLEFNNYTDEQFLTAEFSAVRWVQQIEVWRRGGQVAA